MRATVRDERVGSGASGESKLTASVVDKVARKRLDEQGRHTRRADFERQHAALVGIRQRENDLSSMGSTHVDQDLVQVVDGRVGGKGADANEALSTLLDVGQDAHDANGIAKFRGRLGRNGSRPASQPDVLDEDGRVEMRVVVGQVKVLPRPTATA